MNATNELTDGRSCTTGKVRYCTKQRAKLTAKRIRSQQGGKRVPYRCSLCGGWHITSLTRRKQRKLKLGNYQRPCVLCGKEDPECQCEPPF